MAKAVRPIPEGQHSVTPYMVVRGARQAIDFYKKAFNAKINKQKDPYGHCCSGTCAAA